MVTPAVVRGSAKQVSSDRRSPANMSQRCFLCIIGVLGGFTALVQGMIAVQGLVISSPESFTRYWVVAILGVWVPAIGLMASILGVMIRERFATLLLVLSPVASLGGYFFYTYGPVVDLFRP
jgi:hypothetical protein